MTDFGKRLVAAILRRRYEIPVDLYGFWLRRQRYKRQPQFWEHAR